MKTASVNELKQELNSLPPASLVNICLRLVKFKKENKELVNYILFESVNKPAFIQLVKQEITDSYLEMNRSNVYFAKKTIRKILRFTTKYIRYADCKETEIVLLTHFCTGLIATGIDWPKSMALRNLYLTQYKKIEKAINSLHDDLQYDYRKKLKELLPSL
ncbi:MAG: hypothetical protein RL172_1116 [Bacteroidota bacterium]|jgi:hypothetical protein